MRARHPPDNWFGHYLSKLPVPDRVIPFAVYAQTHLSTFRYVRWSEIDEQWMEGMEGDDEQCFV